MPVIVFPDTKSIIVEPGRGEEMQLQLVGYQLQWWFVDVEITRPREFAQTSDSLQKSQRAFEADENGVKI